MRNMSETSCGNYRQELLQMYYGRYCGILDKINIYTNHSMWQEGFKLIAPTIPGYAAQMYGEDFRIEYHLGGFSLMQSDAFVRSEGEAVERYSHLMAEANLKKKIVTASYDTLRAKGDKVCPLEYVNVYTNEQLANIQMPNFVKEQVGKEDVIEWIPCKSIYDNSMVYIPAQMFFLMSSDKSEQRYYMSVSTGTASHRDKERAMTNALSEYLQLDSMMLSWYNKGKMTKISTVREVIKRLLEDTLVSKEYEVIFCDMTLDKPMYVVGCFLKNKFKKYPYCAFGMQADRDLGKAMYRSFMEAYAGVCPRIVNHSNVKRGDWNNLYYKVKNDIVYNLTENAEFYMSEYATDFVDACLEQIVVEDKKKAQCFIQKEDKLQVIINYLRTVSEYACYLDITSNEFVGDGWCVIRAVIPELLPLCMPSVPYENHPRIRENGGVKNRSIHPCP